MRARCAGRSNHSLPMVHAAMHWESVRPKSRWSDSPRTAWSTAWWRCSASPRKAAMGERLRTRAMVVSHALARKAFAPRTPAAEPPRRILVAHNLLLGDTLMLTPLLAKLRHLYPAAEVV